jgi:hypothetical protein
MIFSTRFTLGIYYGQVTLFLLIPSTNLDVLLAVLKHIAHQEL